eukprot:gene24999-30199_t
MTKDKLFYYMTDEQAVHLLAFIGGYVDAAGYLLLDGLFTSSITGNIVAACTAIYHNDGALARACVCLAFGFTSSAAVYAILRLKLVREWSKRSIGMLLFVLEAILIAISIPIGIAYADEIASRHAIFRWPLILVASILGASMGVHNAAAKEYIPNCPATTVMTMTIVSISIALPQMITYKTAVMFGIKLHPPHKALPADYHTSIAEKAETSTANFVKITKPLIWFIAGAIVGAVIAEFITYYSFLISIFFIFCLVADIYMVQYVQQPEAAAEDEKPNKSVELALMSHQVTPKDDTKDEVGHIVQTGNTLYDKVEVINEEEHTIEILGEDESEKNEEKGNGEDQRV